MACAYADSAVPRNVYIADTQEVAAAKLAHFTEKARAAAAAGEAPDYYTSYYLNYYKNLNNIPAAITVLPTGFLAETPEVAAAKAAFYAEHAKATSAAGAIPIPDYYTDYYKTYFLNNPSAITVLPNGHLADTPEVASAKAADYNGGLRTSA